MRTVMNESLSLLRRAKVEAKAVEPRWNATVTHQADEVDGAALRESVARALLELNEPNRTIVGLRIMEGRSGAEVGRITGYSEPEVSRRLHQGMNQLRGSLRVWAE